MFLDNYVMKFFRLAAWLRKTRAALETMRTISEPVESVWDSTLAKVDSGVVLGYFAATEAEMMYREDRTLK